MTSSLMRGPVFPPPSYPSNAIISTLSSWTHYPHPHTWKPESPLTRSHPSASPSSWQPNCTFPLKHFLASMHPPPPTGFLWLVSAWIPARIVSGPDCSVLLPYKPLTTRKSVMFHTQPISCLSSSVLAAGSRIKPSHYNSSSLHREKQPRLPTAS